jgi:glycerate kinase
VTDPLGRPIDATWLRLADEPVGVIEMASASGLARLTAAERDPLRTATHGTGLLVSAALDAGCTKILLGLGGSATNDGGTGIAQALGVQFRDAKGASLSMNGAALEHLAEIDLSERDVRLTDTTLVALYDVDNPLLGERGAATVYAPQKGATPSQVDTLEAGLASLAHLIEDATGVSVIRKAGAGAAGGTGAGIVGLLDGELQPGTDVVLALVRLDEHVRSADLVLTAEGALDNQTAHGKAPAGVAATAARHDIPCLALAGSVADDLSALHRVGLHAAVAIRPDSVSLEQSMKDAAPLLKSATEQLVRAFRVDRNV